jgi:tape measure domain-containing protein
VTDLATLAIRVQSLEVDAATNKLDRLTRAGKGAESQVGGIARSSRDADKATGNLGRSVAGMVAKYATIGAAVLTVKRLASASLSAAAAMEQQSVSLGVLLGDVDLGNQLFGELQDFAARTPMAVSDLTDAAQQLMSFGIEADNVVGTLQMLGDASLGNASKLERLTRAYGRVQAKGRASMEEINMAMEAGLPIIAELAEAMGVSERAVFDLAAQGEVSAAIFEEAFQSMTSEGGQFHDGMETLSQTFNGKLSTAMDNIRLLGGTMFEPMIERGKVALDLMSGIASAWRTQIDMSRLDREVNRGDVSMGDLSTQEQLMLARYRIQQQITQQEALISAGGLDTETLQRLRSRLDGVDAALERIQDTAHGAGNIIRDEIEAALRRASEAEPPKWFTELEFGFLESTSGLEANIDRQLDVIDRTAEVAAGLGWEYDAIAEKTRVYEDAIRSLLETDPTEFGGRWDEAYKLADPSIQNLIRAMESLQGAQATVTATPYLGGMPSIPGIGNAPSAMGPRDTEGIEEYTDRLSQQRDMIGMNRQELLAYEMTLMGATAAEIEHAGGIQKVIDRSDVLTGVMGELSTMVSGVALTAFEDLGRAMYESSNAGHAIEAGLWSMLDAFVQMLPQLLLMAGLQLIAFGQWHIGLALIAASGLAAIGAGAWNAHKDATRSDIEGRASGGAVSMNTPYVVGEQGMELFVPRTAGTIVPNHALSGGGGGSVTVQVINQAPGVVVERRERSGPSGTEMALFVKAATREAIVRGEMDTAMASRYGIRKRGVSRS